MDEQKAKDRKALEDAKQKSNEFYEKNILYIAAGTLVLSLTFIEKIITLSKSFAVWTLIVSWMFLALTLLVNLLSHHISTLSHDKAISYHDQNDPKILDKIESDNKIIRGMNWFTTFGLMIGIIFLIIFCSINTLKMTNDNRSFNKTNDPNYFEKGLTVTPPSTCVDTTNSSNSSSNNSGVKPSSGQTSNNSSDSPKKK